MVSVSAWARPARATAEHVPSRKVLKFIDFLPEEIEHLPCS
jgi:hypothetical protein